MWLFVAMQFAFGGLFGRFLIYYFSFVLGCLQAGRFFNSCLLLLGNEFAKKYYTRLILQTGFLSCTFLYLFFWFRLL